MEEDENEADYNPTSPLNPTSPHCTHPSPVTRKLVRAKIGPGGPLFAAKIGPTPDYFWLPKVVRVAKSGPGRLNCRNQFCILTIMTN